MECAPLYLLCPIEGHIFRTLIDTFKDPVSPYVLILGNLVGSRNRKIIKQHRYTLAIKKQSKWTWHAFISVRIKSFFNKLK